MEWVEKFFEKTDNNKIEVGINENIPVLLSVDTEQIKIKPKVNFEVNGKNIEFQKKNEFHITLLTFDWQDYIKNKIIGNDNISEKHNVLMNFVASFLKKNLHNYDFKINNDYKLLYLDASEIDFYDIDDVYSIIVGVETKIMDDLFNKLLKKGWVDEEDIKEFYPHITLMTNGHLGIGINSKDDLEKLVIDYNSSKLKDIISE